MEWARFRWIIRRTDILSNLKPNLPKNLEEISSTIPHPEGITLDDKDNIFVSSASTGNIFLVSKNDIKVHANTKGRPLGIAYSKKLNSLIAADAARKSVLRISLGNASISVLCREYEDMDLNGPSDLIITENEEGIPTGRDVPWMPLVDCYKTKSMYILPFSKYKKHEKNLFNNEKKNRSRT